MKSPAGTLRNLGLAIATAAEHLGDDPVLLALHLSRRLPARVLHPLLGAASLVPGNGTVASLGALLSGNKDLLLANLHECTGGRASVRQRLHLADIAIAAGLSAPAAEILAGIAPNARGRRGTEARLRWHDGDMRGAVRALDGGSFREAAQQRRLAAEARVFDDWQPVLAPVSAYRPRPRTVLHVLTNSLPHTQSGYAQRTHSLLRAQQDLGWNVHAVTRLGYPVQVGRLAAGARDEQDRISYHRLLPARMPPGLDRRLQRQAEDTLALAQAIRPEVLHTTTHFTNGLVTAAVARALGIPWVYEVRGQLADTWAAARSDDATLSERYIRFQQREAEVAASADAVATLGERMREKIVAGGTPRERTLLLPNAVGGPFLTQPLPAGAARRRLGLDPESIYIGTVSSLVDYEGLDDLLRAFGLLSPRHPRLRCLIVGSGAAEPALKRLAADLGVGTRVLFAGRVPRDRAHLYHQALDIFVVPRKDLQVTRSVTPLKPVEALASARPVVFSSLPALHELVRDGMDGMSAAPGQPQELSAVLERLLGDSERRKSMGDSGREHTLATRTWQALAGTTTELYERLRGVS